MRKFWQRYKAIEGLPPKPIIDKSITAGRVGAKIKKAYREDGYKSVSDITALVEAEIGPNNRTPSRSTVFIFFEEAGVKKTQITEETPSICQKCGAQTSLRSGKLK